LRFDGHKPAALLFIQPGKKQVDLVVVELIGVFVRTLAGSALALMDSLCFVHGILLL
jgi:hypothetical protein